jgi:WD40 repeat protein
MAISPNGKYLAYIDSYFEAGPHTKSRILRIINSSGHSLSTDYWTLDWQWLIGWLDDQHLAVFTGNKEILVLEPFTGKWERFPKPSWLDRIEYDYYGNDGPFYSPDLHTMWVKPDDASLELRDFQTGQTIYTDKGNGYLNVWDLDWSADGSTLAMGVEKSLHVIAGNQQVIEFDVSQLGINSVNYPKLSPNGQKLIFTSYGSGKLFLLDIPQLKIKRLCTDEFDFFTEAVWSPDGHFVVQETRQSEFDKFDLLIDIEQLRAYKLPSGQYQHRLVWLNEP